MMTGPLGKEDSVLDRVRSEVELGLLKKEISLSSFFESFLTSAGAFRLQSGLIGDCIIPHHSR